VLWRLRILICRTLVVLRLQRESRLHLVWMMVAWSIRISTTTIHLCIFHVDAIGPRCSLLVWAVFVAGRPATP
jgi:hypothetical protein